MKFLTLSEAGFEQPNEDAVVLQRHPLHPDVVLCALADGQGGQPGGGVAARLAVEKAVEKALSFPVTSLTHPVVWMQILTEADDAVCEHQEAGFSTLAVFGVLNGMVYGASCGDSAVLVLTGEGFAVLTEHQQKDPPLGSGRAVDTFFAAELTAPWKIVAISDGVWKSAGWETIKTTLEQFHGEALLTALRQAAGGKSGQLWDDFTVGLIESPLDVR
ncbi:MAG: protein phosphatase 2C domain-containing protein [Blastocatellia bacterium]|nr:protein phosphatase 2C domain-containing protein [Blastocatellia bacterium]